MRLAALLSLCLFVAAAHVSRAEADDDLANLPRPGVEMLTAANFEQRTQAATGATTGDWIVMFYAPWCGHCQHAKPAFEAVAATYHSHRINVALVDCDADGSLCRRFGVRGYPTVILFRRGKAHKYFGERSTSSFISFATETTLQMEGERVPPVPTLVDEAMFWVGVVRDDLLMLHKEQPLVFYAAIGVFAVVMILVGILASRPLEGRRPAVAGNRRPAAPAKPKHE